MVDPLSGQVNTVAKLPGVVRGLALHGGFAFVGLSKARPTLEGVPIVARRDELQCGLWVVDLTDRGRRRPSGVPHRSGRGLRRAGAAGDHLPVCFRSLGGTGYGPAALDRTAAVSTTRTGQRDAAEKRKGSGIAPLADPRIPRLAITG